MLTKKQPLGNFSRQNHPHLDQVGGFTEDEKLWYFHPIAFVQHLKRIFSFYIDYELLYSSKGPAYTRFSSKTHYNDPIDTSNGRLHGNSRRAGDADKKVQKAVIDTLVEKGEEYNLTFREICTLLAIAKLESGLNPDAAAGTTSASGIGQFIDGTGEKYGLTDNASRFSIETGSEALVKHFIDNRDLAKKRGFTGRELEIMIYKYHHDGPTKDYGGRALSVGHVMPLADKLYNKTN